MEALLDGEPDAPSPVSRHAVAALARLWCAGPRGRWLAQRIAGVMERLAPGARRARALATAHNATGVIRYDSLDPAGAEASFRAAIARYPFAAHFHTNLAGSLLHTGRSSEAGVAAAIAIAIDPDNVVGWWWLAESRASLGQRVAAEAAAVRASQLATDPADMTAPLRAALSAGDTAKAGQLARALIAKYPRHQAPYISLGHILNAQAAALAAEGGSPGDVEATRLEAVSCYRRAAAITPGDAQIQLSIGGLLLALHRPADAAAAYGRALALAPGSAEAMAGRDRAEKALPPAQPDAGAPVASPPDADGNTAPAG